MKASDFFKVTDSETDGANKINYAEFVRSQIKNMDVDDVIVADVGCKKISDFRMNANKISQDLNYKIKTKFLDGKLYVGRIA